MSEMDRNGVSFKHKFKMLTIYFASIFFIISSILMFSIIYPKKAEAVHADTSTSWSDNTSTTFAGGSGSPNDPYLISSGSELAYLAKYTNEGNFTTDNYRYFKLTKPIDLSTYDWTPIGSGIGKAFYGELDCNNYPIVGLKITKKVEYAGLFGFVDSLVIKNAIISGANINITNEYGSAGIIAGSINYSNGELKVIDSMITGSITHTSYPSATDGVGGLIGSIRSCSVSDCLFENVSMNVKITTPNRIENACTGVVAGFSDVSLSLDTNIQNIVANANLISSNSSLTRKIYSGDFGGTSTSDWFYNDRLNDGAPLQKKKYWIGKDSSVSGTQIVSQLGSKGYSKIDTILGLIPSSKKYVVTTNYIVTNNTSRTGFSVAAQTRTGFPNAVYGEKVDLSSTTITGYNLKTYRVDGNDISGNFFLMPEKDVTVTAVFAPEKYTVTFEPNGGTVSPATKTVEYDGTYGELPTPTREGYTFNGWIGKNLFDKNAEPMLTTAFIFEGRALNAKNYGLGSAREYNIYQVQVPAGENITFTNKASGYDVVTLRIGFAFFTTDEQLISFGIYERSGVNTILVPDNTRYMRISVNPKYQSWLSSLQIEIGESVTEYEEFKIITPETNIEQNMNHYLCASWKKNEAFFPEKADWKTYVRTALSGVSTSDFDAKLKSVEFTDEQPTVGTAISIGETGAQGYNNGYRTRRHNGTIDDCYDVTAYVTGDKTNGFDIKFYSPYVICFPANSERLFSGFSTNFKKIETVTLKNVSASKTTNVKYMFAGFSSLPAINLISFDTSQAKDISYLFGECSALTRLDLSVIDTSNAIKMDGLFYKCTKLTSIDLTPLNTSKVTSMSSMFSGCSSLTSIDLTPLNTSNVTDLSNLFSGCSALTEIDLSPLDTSNVTNMTGLFRNCSGLTSLDFNQLDTSKVTNMSYMFQGININDLDFSQLDTSQVTDMSGMFVEVKMTSLDLTGLNTSNVTNMASMFNKSRLTSLDLRPLDTSKVVNMASMFYYCSSLKSIDLSLLDTSNVTSMSSMFYNCWNLTSIDLSSLDTSKVTSMWQMFYSCSALTSLDLSNFDTGSVTNMDSMFYGCRKLASINLENINTQNVKSMESMFYNCDALASLDLSNFDTSNVTTMESMFNKCYSLTALDLSSFNTSNATTISSMFYDCRKLTELKLGNFVNTKVTSMGYIFDGCSGLTELDLSSFYTSNATNMACLFRGCSGLTSLDLSTFETSKVTNMGYLFSGCSGLTSLDLTPLDTSKVTNMSYMFYGCTGLKNLDLTQLNTSSVTNMSYMFGKTALESIDFSSMDTNKVTTMSYMFTEANMNNLDLSTLNASSVTNMSYMFYKAKFTSINFNNFNTSNVTNMSYMFNQLEIPSLDLSPLDTGSVTNMSYMFAQINTDTLDLSGLDTSSVTNMSSMFSMSMLTNIILNNFNTSNVTNMSYMFSGCSGLTSINLSSFDTSNVTSMSYMFNKCSGLTSIDLSSFNTSKVKNMNRLFAECSGLTTINLSPLNTSNTTDISGMFSGCLGLTSIDLSPLNTSNVTNMSYMFGSCKGLTSLDLTPLDTRNVTSMSGMFSGCTGLTSLDLTPLNTSNVTNMSSMFYNLALDSIDLSSLNTSKVTNMMWMFDASKFKVLDLSSFDTSNVTNMSYMFENCSELKELDLSSFDMSKVTSSSTYRMFTGANALKIVRTPKKLASSLYIGSSFYDSNLTSYSSVPASITASMELRKGYSIYFSANGGTCGESSRIIRYGENYGLRGDLPTPTRDGFTFLGWFTATTDGTKIENDDVILDSYSSYIYAHWEPNIIKATFDMQEGEGGTQEIWFRCKQVGYYTDAECTVSFEGSSIVVPTREGYVFKGYYTEIDGGGSQYVTNTGGINLRLRTSTSDLTLYAYWVSSG